MEWIPYYQFITICKVNETIEVEFFLLILILLMINGM